MDKLAIFPAQPVPLPTELSSGTTPGAIAELVERLEVALALARLMVGQLEDSYRHTSMRTEAIRIADSDPVLGRSLHDRLMRFQTAIDYRAHGRSGWREVTRRIEAAVSLSGELQGRLRVLAGRSDRRDW